MLAGLTLEVRAQEVVALVGASGNGKSTVLGLLQRLYDPGRGTVSLDGHDVRLLDPRWLRQQMGVVRQEPALFATTVRARFTP